ncbi:GDYXXLXY domain-containing protein [Labrenzia aggregata]|uniref:GDYXXLXY domain-containing protein n=1 Tax=Roseibium aggregatum TaxID=187304 RepID=A0A939E9X0_9HYPH|nr:GDYXXLXY domain-containing protein [Roseibium aggregatum]
MIWGLIALIQLALVAFPLVERLQVQTTGEVVALELVPVDPRDLLRGDYVVINLAIGEIGIEVPGSSTVGRGDRVYVGLSTDGNGPARPIVVSKDRAKAGETAIAGIVRYEAGDHLRIDYGIDAFFLPEGLGKVIERLDTRRLKLTVAISEDGRSLPLALLVDGQEFRSDGLF